MGARLEHGYRDGRGGRALRSVARGVSWVSRTRLFRQRHLTRDPELFFRASVVGCARVLVGVLLVDGGFELLPEPAGFCGDLATLLNVAGTVQLAHDLPRLICVPIWVLTGLKLTNSIKRALHVGSR